MNFNGSLRVYRLGVFGDMRICPHILYGLDFSGIFAEAHGRRRRKENACLKLGYRKVVFDRLEISGHEFHYSDIKDLIGLPSVARQYNIRGKEVLTPVYRYKNVIAGYTHLYWAETEILNLWENE